MNLTVSQNECIYAKIIGFFHPILDKKKKLFREFVYLFIYYVCKVQYNIKYQRKRINKHIT